jgi:hypothetical protein
MTTATTEDTREKAAAGVAYFANAEPLIRAISNGLLFAGDDGTLPALTCLEFDFDGSQLQVATTDRYRLCIETVELDRAVNHEGQPPFRFLLQRQFAKQALTPLKANKRGKLTLVRHADRPDSVEFVFYEQTASYPVDRDHTFPPVRQLIPSADNRTAVDEIGFTPRYLGDLAKVQCSSRVAYVRIWTYGAHKPTRIDYQDGPTVVLMPVKTNADSGTWGSV